MTRSPRPVAVAYVRVSTQGQAVDGASLAAQETMLRAEAIRRGWDVELVVDEGFSGKDMRRPGLVAALERLDMGTAQVLIAVRLDRLSRSVADFATLLERAARRGWRLLLLSPELDTADASGKFMAHVLAAAAEFERALIAARTREGMAQRRLQGHHMGRPRTVPKQVIERVITERSRGETLQKIADGLTRDSVPTARGGATWRPSTIHGLLRSITGERLRRQLEASP